jgi:peroxiredoxin Q/BCP
MRAFTGDLSRFADAGTVVLGISRDDEASHAAFAAKFGLQTPLLADPDGAVCRAYGTLEGQRDHPDRVLFVIDKRGVVRHVHNGMPDNDALLSILQGLT